MFNLYSLIRSPFGLQLAAVLLCSVVGMGWWQQSHQDLERRSVRHDLLHRLDAEIRAVTRQPGMHALGDAEARGRYNRSMGSLRSHIESLYINDEEILEPLTATVVELDAFDDQAGRFWDMPYSGASVGSLATQALTLQGRMSDLHDYDASLRNEQSELYFQGFIWLWLSGLGIYLGTGWWARRWLVQQAEAARAERQIAIDSVIQSLGQAAAGLFVDPCVSHPETEALVAKVEEFALQFDAVRAEAAYQQRSADFTRQLGLALDLADTEAAVQQTTTRAAREAFPSARLQIWMADNSHSALVPRCGDGPAVCSAESPYTCPAIRRSTVEVNLPGDGLARCPHLHDDEHVVTCSFLAIGGRAAGVVQLVGDELDDERRASLAEMTRSVGRRLSVVRTLDERALQASTDVLTGLANRRKMNERLAQLDSERAPYAVIACDLDHFKRLNDSFGHEVGDRCLKVFAQVLRDCLDGDGLACRPGGEEFLVILPGVGVDEGLRYGEAVRQELRAATKLSGVGFTVSIGVAARPAHGSDSEAVQRVADAALYRAKEGGRDQVCLGEIQLEVAV